uniref:Armadillo repeat containing 3 n=1 Tax=Sparus aurata TaxID=8175 RepID=A0A671WHB7_SPAAU
MGKKVRKESETPCKETFEPLPVEGKNPATVVLLLSSPEEDILVKACEAIHTFAEKGDENKVSLLGLGALEPLCQLISHDNKLVRRSALMALGIMTANSESDNIGNQCRLAFSVIWWRTMQPNVVVHEFATLCLASLSVDFVCKVQIFDSKGLPTLIQLLCSPDPDVKKNSLETIFNMVQDYQSRQAVHELGGIPQLLELLNSEFPVIQHLALRTLQNVTTDKDTRNTFREEQGFEKLMDILSNADFSDLHIEALQVVANCLNDSESFQLIHQGGGLTRLTEFIITPNITEIQSCAVKCIARVAQSAENRKLLHEQNVEKVLVELLSVSDVSVKTASCQAVSKMSFHLACKDCFRDLGGIPEIVQLLNNEMTDNLRTFLFILVQQLYGNCAGTVANSAATLGNMAGQGVIRCSILLHGAMQALVEPLKSTNVQVLVNTTQCLAMLACDTEARAELQTAGGLQPLVNLLRSYHKEVLHNACLAINVCASDEPTAVEMCRFGAVELLHEINQSVKRRSSVSKLAMTSLLNSNLSVKYSLTGHLSSTDIIRDGFYDAGKVSVCQRILTLEELSEQPVNQQRPIIFVNTSRKITTYFPAYFSDTDSDFGLITPLLDRKKKQKDETQPESPTEKQWKMMDDVSLPLLVKEVKESILPLSEEREQYAALARLVSEAMGGAVEMEKLHEFPWVLHLSELKFQLQSNVVPIGLIRRGIYRHRALLFKCLVDCIGLSCTLVRGEYNRAWNEVLLFTGNPSSNGRSSLPCRYIVDLLHQPGSLLKANTPAAVQYQTI